MTTARPLHRFTVDPAFPRHRLALFVGNPRTIDKHARRKLKAAIKQHGLVEPLVANRRLAANGHPPADDGRIVLIGGHQRLSVSDELYRYDPAAAPDPETGENPTSYPVPLAINEVSPAAETALVIALNNPGLQGSWDAAKLEDLFSQLAADPEFDIAQTGFERVDLAFILDEGSLASIFGQEAAEQEAAEQPIAQQLEAMRQAGIAEKKAGEQGGESREQEADDWESTHQDKERIPWTVPTPGESDETVDNGATAPHAVEGGDASESEQPEHNIFKDRRQSYIDRQADNRDKEFMVVLVFDGADQVTRFLTHFGMDATVRYHSGARLAAEIGVEL